MSPSDDDRKPLCNSDGSVNLLEYVRERFDSLERNLGGQLGSQQKILDKVESNINTRLAEIQNRMEDFCTKASVEALELRIRALENAKSNLDGRLVVVGAVWAIVIIAVNYFIRTKFS